MSEDVQVRICEHLRGRFPRVTRLVITGKTKELLQDEVMPRVEGFLKERGLTLSEAKTRITHIEEGFDFLGWTVRKYGGKLLIKPSRKNVSTFLKDIRETVKANKQATQENLIRLLNPKIRGWTNYHRHAVAKKAFAKVDHEIWKMLWRWAKRRHPGKGNRWIKDRYFQSVGNLNWVFTTAGRTPRGAKPMTLVKASDTRIRRHIKIRGSANPFDPKEETYFENRLGWTMATSLQGNGKLRRLWWSQDKECPICNQKITKENPSHPSKIGRWQGQPVKSGPGASQLPQTNSQPNVDGSETGSREGALKRLEPDAEKFRTSGS